MKVMCVDNEPVELHKMETKVSSFGYQVMKCNGAQALAIDSTKALELDVAVVDQNLESDITGEQVGRALRALNPRIYLIMLTAYSSVERGVEAVRTSEFDYYI